MIYVAVCGGAACGDAESAIAEQIGRHVAQAGAIVVCGGLGGVMEAACRGARASGGLTVGILPGTDRGDANPYVQIAIPTGLGEARNAIVVRAADAVVAVAGEYGTLSEIALALKLGIPVVGVRTWRIAREGLSEDHYPVVDTGEEAAGLALRLAGR